MKLLRSPTKYRLGIRSVRGRWDPQETWRAQGLGMPLAGGILVAPLWHFVAPIFFIYSIKISTKFRPILRTFISPQKQHHGSSAENNASRVSFIQIMQI